jgi:hypothetical protein
MTFKNFLLGCVTGKDNETPDVGRILLIIGVIFYIIMEIMDVYQTHTFECKEWAEGLAYLLGGGGLLLFLKKNTEPGN